MVVIYFDYIILKVFLKIKFKFEIEYYKYVLYNLRILFIEKKYIYMRLGVCFTVRFEILTVQN